MYETNSVLFLGFPYSVVYDFSVFSRVPKLSVPGEGGGGWGRCFRGQGFMG